MREAVTLKIGNIVDLNFKKLNDAQSFASGYNRGIKIKDFDYCDFDSEMEKRGFDFSIKVWSMLRIHAEQEETFRKTKAIIVGSSPRRFKTRVLDKIVPKT
jgi:hypothetical protein